MLHMHTECVYGTIVQYVLCVLVYSLDTVRIYTCTYVRINAVTFFYVYIYIHMYICAVHNM